ncbi:hypothetical protein Avbf_11005 [Armadillidium vulgare]|nr:hypothetical protein Avbf_11005 [Armadillidium vulgare]
MVSLNRNRGRYSVTPILADLAKRNLQDVSKIFADCLHMILNLLKNISPYSCSTYSPLGTVDIEEKILAPCSWGHEQGNMSSLL